MPATIRVPARRRKNNKSFELEASEWNHLERTMNGPFNGALRETICFFSTSYAIAGDSFDYDNSENYRDLRKSVERWLSETEKLIKLLQPKGQDREQQHSLARDPGRVNSKAPSRGLPTEVLLRDLERSYQTGRSTLSKLDNMNVGIEVALWNAWVAAIGRALEEHGFVVTSASQNKNANQSPFVILILALQARLPQACRRRTTAESVVQGIKLARPWMDTLSRQNLALILSGFGLQILPELRILLDSTADAAELDLALSEVSAIIEERARTIAPAKPT